MKQKIKISDIFAYMQGTCRNTLFYSRFSFLIRKHIREQIVWRISVMDIDCYSEGSCKICGCETVALQMANKACPKPCYPEMMTKKKWSVYKLKIKNYEFLEESRN